LRKHVGEIDARGQFHQHFMSAFLYESASPAFLSLQSQNITRKKLSEALLYKKFASNHVGEIDAKSTNDL